MADNGTTFIKRVISAVLAGLVVLSICYYGGVRGMQFVVIMSAILSVREFERMAFRKPLPATIGWFYYLTCAVLLASLVAFFEWRVLVFSLAVILFLVGTLWLARGRVANESLLTALTLGCFGMMYCVLFPSFALNLVSMTDGARWFLFLLLVVFFGDTFAYFGGRWFGATKMMPDVSPKKTWAGAIAGLLGSCLSGVYTAPDAGILKTLAFCVVCGIVAQSGDLLMSLIKRVAHVKDSGTIMPGHGGVLDRLDGIFIACPLVYAFALYSS